MRQPQHRRKKMKKVKKMLVSCSLLVAVLFSGSAVMGSSIENEYLKAGVKRTELNSLVYKPSGKELMSSTYHGALGINAHDSGSKKWLIQNSFTANRISSVNREKEYDEICNEFDWRVPSNSPETSCFRVKQTLRLFKEQPLLRVHYNIKCIQPHKALSAFMVIARTNGNKIIEEVGNELKVRVLNPSFNLSGLGNSKNYWIAYYNDSSGDFLAFLRPGETDPMRCYFRGPGANFARQNKPFINKPDDIWEEELWLLGGNAKNLSEIRDKVNEAWQFIAKKSSHQAKPTSKIVTYKELLSKYAHLMAKGKGERVEYRDERLYVDGEPFLFFGSYYIRRADYFELCKKYHLTGVFGASGYLDKVHEYGLMMMTHPFIWPRLEGKALEEHIVKLSKHPALLLYFLQDDFSGIGDMPKKIEVIRKYDTYRPTAANIIGYDPGRRQSSTFIDICSPYTYPAPVHTYSWYADFLDHNREIMKRKFIFTVPQANSFSRFAKWGQPVSYYLKYPAAAQMRLETYIGLAHGVRGFKYWPGRSLFESKRKLSEVGILCCEMEYAKDIIVEGEPVKDGAVSYRDDIKVARIDKGEDILLIVNQYKKGYETWIPEWVAESVSIKINNTAVNNREAYLVSLPSVDEFLVKQVGKDLVITAKRLSGCDLILLTSDKTKIDSIRKKQASLLPDVSGFAVESAEGTEVDVGDILAQCMNRPIDLTKAAIAFNSGQEELHNAKNYLADKEYLKTFITARKSSSLFRKAGQIIIDKAKSISDYAPLYARHSLLINFYVIPQYFAAFDFPPEPAMKYKLSRPWRLPSEDSAMPGGITDLCPDRESSTRGTAFLHTEPGKSYLLRTGKLYAGKDELRVGKTDCIPLPNNNLSFERYLFSPKEGEEWYAQSAGNFISAISIKQGEKIKGRVLSAKQAAALFTLSCEKNTSYKFTLNSDRGVTLDLQVAVAGSPSSYLLAQTTAPKQGATQAVVATAHHNGELSIVVERRSGEGSFMLMAEELSKVIPLKKVTSPFKKTRFAFYGKNTAAGIETFNSKGVEGSDLTGELLKTDLSNIDVIIMLTNAVKYDKEKACELKACSTKLRQFVQKGGKLLVLQQNGRETWHDSWLPYRLKLTIGSTHILPSLQNDRGILRGLEGSAFVRGKRVIGYYPMDVSGSDKHWTYRAWIDASRRLALLAECQYGKGKIVFVQFAIFDRVGEPIMQELLDRLLSYVVKQ